MATFSQLAVQNNYEISEYILEPDAFMQRLLVQILFVFLLVHNTIPTFANYI